MSKRSVVGSGDRAVLKRVEGRTSKVTVSLTPALADRLRLAAVGLKLDQGDIVAIGLAWALRDVQAHVSVRPPSRDSVGGAAVRLAGDTRAEEVA